MIGQEWSRGVMRVRNLADMHGRHNVYNDIWNATPPPAEK